MIIIFINFNSKITSSVVQLSFPTKSPTSVFYEKNDIFHQNEHVWPRHVCMFDRMHTVKPVHVEISLIYYIY